MMSIVCVNEHLKDVGVAQWKQSWVSMIGTSAKGSQVLSSGCLGRLAKNPGARREVPGLRSMVSERSSEALVGGQSG
jgi:hypothetical protein